MFPGLALGAHDLVREDTLLGRRMLSVGGAPYRVQRAPEAVGQSVSWHHQPRTLHTMRPELEFHRIKCRDFRTGSMLRSHIFNSLILRLRKRSLWKGLLFAGLTAQHHH